MYRPLTLICFTVVIVALLLAIGVTPARLGSDGSPVWAGTQSLNVPRIHTLRQAAEEQVVRVPPITPDEQTNAVLLAEADPRVQTIIDGHQYRVASVVVWTTVDLVKLGGVVEFALESPGTFLLDWPFVEANSDGVPMYPPRTDRFEVRQMQTFTVFIDFARNDVVQIVPGYESAFSTVVP